MSDPAILRVGESGASDHGHFKLEAAMKAFQKPALANVCTWPLSQDSRDVQPVDFIGAVDGARTRDPGGTGSMHHVAQTGTRLAPDKNKRGLTTPSNPFVYLWWALSDSNTRPTD